MVSIGRAVGLWLHESVFLQHDRVSLKIARAGAMAQPGSQATVCDRHNIKVRVNAKNKGGDEWRQVYQCILLDLWEASWLNALCGMPESRETVRCKSPEDARSNGLRNCARRAQFAVTLVRASHTHSH